MERRRKTEKEETKGKWGRKGSKWGEKRDKKRRK